MKYLLFNVAVAAALVFLFTADRGEVQKIAGKAHDAASDMKDYANKVLDNGQTMLGRDAAKADRKTEPVPAATPAPAAVAPSVTPTTTRPEPLAEPASVPPSKPSFSRQLARNLPAMPEIGSETSKAASVNLDPDVVKRRREVLNGIDTATTVAKVAPALKEGTRLMTPSERRRELLSLAEEMELLYARSISQ